MKQVEFAELCGVSRQQISKYSQTGRLKTLLDGRIEPKESLMLLEGHLDEGKRRAALMRLAGIEMPAAAVHGDAGSRSAIASRAATDDPQADNVVDHPSWRVRRDRAEAQMRELDLAERQGLLVEAADVRLAVGDAVASFWSEIDRRRRQDSDAIASELMLDAAAAAKLRLLIARRDRKLRADYAERMREKAAEIAPPPRGLADELSG